MGSLLMTNNVMDYQEKRFNAGNFSNTGLTQLYFLKCKKTIR